MIADSNRRVTKLIGSPKYQISFDCSNKILMAKPTFITSKNATYRS